MICWALVIALPLMLPASLLVQPASGMPSRPPLGGARLCVAVQHADRLHLLVQRAGRGRIAAVGQLQLLQPFFGLGLSAALLHETVSPLMLAVTLGVVLCVVGSRKFGRQRVGEENGGNN